ncbi:unnamed protein product, partial [Cladocopium goreaui]
MNSYFDAVVGDDDEKEQNKVEVAELQNSQEEVPKLQRQLVEVEGQLAAALAEVTHLKAEKELSEALVQDLQQALAKAEDQVSFCEKRLAEVEARNSQTLADLAAAEADGSQVKDLQEQSTAARAAMADLVTDKEESLATIKNGSLSQAQEQELPPMPLAPPESRMEGDELWNATANDRRDFFHRTNTPSNDEGEPAGLPLQTR